MMDTEEYINVHSDSGKESLLLSEIEIKELIEMGYLFPIEESKGEYFFIEDHYWIIRSILGRIAEHD